MAGIWKSTSWTISLCSSCLSPDIKGGEKYTRTPRNNLNSLSVTLARNCTATPEHLLYTNLIQRFKANYLCSDLKALRQGMIRRRWIRKGKFVHSRLGLITVSEDRLDKVSLQI